MKKQMTLSTDRKSASEGEYIEIKWTCEACPDSLYLAIDSGCTQYSIAVSDSGSTKIPVPKSNGKMTVKLIGVISGKKVTESIDIRVKGAKRTKSKAQFSSRIKMFREKMKYWWLSQKKWQKALWIALLVLWLGMLIVSSANNSASESSSDQMQNSFAEGII